MEATSLDELARKWRAAQSGAGPVPALYVDPEGTIGEVSPGEAEDRRLSRLTSETFATPRSEHDG